MMDQLEIRHKLEEKVKEIGGKIKGAGCMMVPPFTMDFAFELDGRRYTVNLTDIEELKKRDSTSDFSLLDRELGLEPERGLFVDCEDIPQPKIASKIENEHSN
jgi:hypothetical protein